VAGRLLLLVAFSLAAAAWPVGVSPEEINPAELGVLAAAFTAVLTVQCAAVWVIGHFARDQVIDAVIGILIAANAFHFAFLTVEGKTALRVSLAIAVGLGIHALLRAGVSRATMLLFASLFTVLSLGQYIYGRASLSETNAKRSAAPDAIALKSARNVYLISTESLHSPYAFRRLYGLEDAPHATYLATEGFRILDRSYSVDTSTRVAYQRVMEFSKELTDPSDLKRVFKFGNSTFKSFQNAGYGVQFIYISNYMNLNHALVDHAYPKTGFYICDNLPKQFFYFICRQHVRATVNGLVFGIEGEVTVAQEIAHLKERIRIAAADTRPWLTISHIAFPSHTGPDHRYDDASQIEAFREQTRDKLPKIAAHYREIVTAIKQHDPDAVIVTFGDHGMWLTRGMSSAEPNAIFKTEDYVEDRYGAMIGVYPADFCRDRIFEGSSTALLAKSIIECLNGNDDPTAEDLERSRSIVYQNNFVVPEKITAPR
jgi:hypothetical protein